MSLSLDVLRDIDALESARKVTSGLDYRMRVCFGAIDNFDRPFTRSEIEANLGITQTIVRNVVADLTTLNLLESAGRRPARRADGTAGGRPAPLSVATPSLVDFCIDYNRLFAHTISEHENVGATPNEVLSRALYGYAAMHGADDTSLETILKSASDAEAIHPQSVVFAALSGFARSGRIELDVQRDIRTQINAVQL